jgi:endonuclease/exonuclease/phosphatase family metal-dependent hydrolase
LRPRKTSTRARLVAFAGVAAGLAAMLAPVAAQAAPPEGRVKVMSRNIYLGSDLTGALAATTPTELAVAAQDIWGTVDVTEFPNRAKLLAKEIKNARPDLVGLQEVALWRGDFATPYQDGPATPATTVSYDFLRLLKQELKRQGAKYRVVRQQKEADIEMPLAFPGGDFPGDGRLTMRDVVLARDDKNAGVKAKFDQSSRFRKDHSLVVENIGGTPLDITVWRGWVAVDAKVRGTKFRFVNTHLEAFDNIAKLAQAEELVAGIADVGAGTQDEIGPANPGGVDVPVVLVGDLNSDNEIVEDEGDTPQHQADELPYAAIVDAGLEERSFDGPEEDAIDDAVYSCCFGDDEIGEDPSTALDDIDHTVDHVMVSDDDHGLGTDPNGNDVELVNSFATGADPAEFARFDRWASDHLGVFSALQFPTP